MKISEAMRKGAKMGKQLFNHANDRDGGTCAFWAMVKGAPRQDISSLENAHLFNTGSVCPVKMCDKAFTNGSVSFGGVEGPCYVGRAPSNVSEVIVHLNNDHRWTRECIAGWIEATFEGGVPSTEIMEMIGEPVKEAVLCTKGPRVTERLKLLKLFHDSVARFGIPPRRGGSPS